MINNPREYAMELVTEGLVDAETVLLACLNHMSYDDVIDMLNSNELTSIDDDDDDEEE